jgi:UDP-glucose 4-epimerase
VITHSNDKRTGIIMQKIIMTGASGLVGSHLIPLLAKTCEIHMLSRSKPSTSIRNVRYHNIDLSGEVDYSQLPPKVDAIVYLAQSDNYRDFPEKAADVFQVNTSQVLHMLNYARRAGARTFIYASSGGIYGSSETETGVSEDILVPANGKIGFYSSTKLCSEILAENFAPYMNIALLRFFFVYGRGQKRSMLIPRLVDNVLAGNSILLQGQDGIKINPVHASDAAHAIQAALTLEGCNRINVAGPDVLSLREICGLIGINVGVQPVYQIDQTSQPQNLIGDIENMKKYLWKPSRHFEEGMVDLI